MKTSSGFGTFMFSALNVALAVSAETVPTAHTSPDLGSLVQRIKENLQPRLREAVSQPSDTRSAQTIEDTKAVIEKLRELDKERLDFVASANQYRMIAFLEVMLARVEGERVAYQSGVPGTDPNQNMSACARSALADIKTAQKYIREAVRPDSNIRPELLQWMKLEDIPGHLLHLEAHAHAMVWKATGAKTDQDAAHAAWTAASRTAYGKKNTQPSPELANALALWRRGEDPRLVVTLLWIGVALIILGVVIAIFVPRPTSFQMFTFRILASLGAAGIGASLPGFIGFKSASITAGGAVALLVLIYLVNPPRLASNLAGNDPPR